jgi:hypothetical protein
VQRQRFACGAWRSPKGNGDRFEALELVNRRARTSGSKTSEKSAARTAREANDPITSESKKSES